MKVVLKGTARQIKLDPDQWGINLEFLEVGKLRVDRLAYQRPFQQSKADKIANEFDKKKFDPIRVNLRPDGTAWVVDGQHRLVALKKVGIEWVPAIVEREETVAKEAEQFIAVNTMRTRPDSFALFKAGLTAGDPTVLAAQRLLDETGWTFNDSGKNTRQGESGLFSAPTTLLTVYNRYGELFTKQALSVIREVWPNDPLAGSANMLSGMTRLLFKFGDVIVIKRLINKLSTVTPGHVISQAKQLSDILPGHGGQKIDDAVAQVLFNQYQKGARGIKWDWSARGIVIGEGRKAVRRDYRPVRPRRTKVADETEASSEDSQNGATDEVPDAKSVVSMS